MSKDEILESAIEVAVQFHKGQKDKNKEPYILHPLRVMMKCGTYEEKIVAVLHDVLEDTSCTEEYLMEVLKSEELLDAIKTLTRKRDEQYFDYIKRVKGNALAATVKKVDLEDNLSRPGASASLRKRYDDALQVLYRKDNVPKDETILAEFYGFIVTIDCLCPEVKYLKVNYQDEYVFEFSLESEVFPEIAGGRYLEPVFMGWYREHKKQIRKMIEENIYYMLPDWEDDFNEPGNNDLSKSIGCMQYEVGESVSFCFFDGKEEHECYGTVEAVDIFRTEGEIKEVSYDIMGPDYLNPKKKILYKHIEESWVKRLLP